MNDHPKIVVVGSSNTDMVVKSARIPEPGETVSGGMFVMAQGGKGANQAVAAARLGAEVVFISRVGEDMFGDEAIRQYEKDGIDTTYIEKIPDCSTGVALILVDENGENMISVASGANHRLDPAAIQKADRAFDHADMIVVQLETPMETLEYTAQIAKEKGIPILLDPAPAPQGGLPRSLMEKITVIKPNETEAFRLTGIFVSDPSSAQRAADTLLDYGVQKVIITLGTQGAWLVESPGTGILIPSRLVQAVDTTAAGDSFSGAFAVAFSEGKSFIEAAKFASLAASCSVMKLGAQPSLPFRKDLNLF